MTHLEKTIIPERMSEDSFLTLIRMLGDKFDGVKTDIPEFVWDKMKKTVGYTRREITFGNGYKAIFGEKHRISEKNGIVTAGGAIHFTLVNTIGFTY